MSETLPAVRGADGKFLPGASGNPGGRPSRNKLINLQRQLEITVREHINPERVKRIINKVCEMAEGGNIHAAKLILDKLVSNASTGEETPENGRTVVFRIENATFAAQQKKAAPIEHNAVDAEFTAVDTSSIPSVPQDQVNGH